MKIAHLDFPHGLFLAPMAGITDLPMRAVCKKYGAEGVFTEMISSRALCYQDKKTALLAEIRPDEHPCFIQLFGNDPDTMASAAEKCLQFSPDGIDLNMGCPAPKIVNNGDGSSLMKKPLLAYEIVKTVKERMLPHGIPVTVKMRSGFDSQSKNAVELALLCEKAGADAITVHGRTREQMYAPPADLESIREVKKAVSVPVIGNGDITGAETAMRMLDYTGCDGIMIGRGATGNPYIFEELTCALSGTPYKRPEPEKICQDASAHIAALCEYKGMYTGVREARKHVSWYLKGVPGAAGYRDAVNRTESLEQILELLRKAFGV